MDTVELTVNGGSPLKGEVYIQGSKNAALPIMAATLLTQNECVIHNCPIISDTKAAAEILSFLGADVEFEKNTVIIRAVNIGSNRIPEELMLKMRSSVMFLGALLARCKRAVICSPGGCKLGERPIDIHLNALKLLGVEICRKGSCIYCNAEDIDYGSGLTRRIDLLYPSVGATENIMLFAVGAGLSVRIYNAAREPEITALQSFLNQMGADVRGGGCDVITVRPVNNLHGCEHTVIPDRIVALTYACGVAACGGTIRLINTEPKHMELPVAALRYMGCNVKAFENDNGLCCMEVSRGDRCKGTSTLKTLPYPGFPTDVQPMFTAALSTARGKSEICEAIFKNRFGYVKQLLRMGADIRTEGSCIKIFGKDRLKGASVAAEDLRGGAALVIAAAAAEGKSQISGLEYIDRGYESIERDLTALGADIKRCSLQIN